MITDITGTATNTAHGTTITVRSRHTSARTARAAARKAPAGVHAYPLAEPIYRTRTPAIGEVLEYFDRDGSVVPSRAGAYD